MKSAPAKSHANAHLVPGSSSRLLNPEDAVPLSDGTGATAAATISSDPTRVPLPISPVLSGLILPDDSSVVTKRVFVAIRPPGHHCSDEVPSGFCFINNVLVAAAHGTRCSRIYIFTLLNSRTYRNSTSSLRN